MSQTNTESVASDSKSKRKKTSWIWQHFKEEEIEENGVKFSVIICQEKDDDGEPCNKIYKNVGSSTDNAINHLYSVHNLSSDGINEVSNVNKVGLTILFN